jgi:hypothetical protein
MSEKESFWLPMSLKLFGILVAIIGGLFLYFTYTSTNALGVFTGFFGFLGVIILILGLFMILIKTKE